MSRKGQEEKKQSEKTTKTKGVHFNKLDPVESYLLKEAEKVNFSNLMKYLFLTYMQKRGEAPPGLEMGNLTGLMPPEGQLEVKKEDKKEEVVDKVGIRNAHFSLDDDDDE